VFGVGWSALNTGSAALISIGVFVVTSRLLLPVDFGVVALSVAIIAFIACATPAAFGEAIMQRAEIAGSHLDTVFWLCIGAGVLLYLPILLFSGVAADLIGQPALATLLPFVGLKLVIDMAAVVPQALVVRAMKFKYIAARTAIGNSVGGLVCVAMALNGYGVWALATAPVMTSLVALVILARAAGWRPGLRLRRDALRDLLRFGLFASGNHILHTISLDKLLLGTLAGPAVLGLYYLGKRLYDLLSGLTAGSLYPVTTVYFASIQTHESQHLGAFGNAVYATTLLVFPVFGGLLVLAESAVPLILGQHWLPAMPAIEAFAVIGILAGLRVPSSSLASGLGRADLWFYVDLTRHIMNAAVILIFVGDGLEAIMIGLMLANAAVIPGCYLVARKLTGITVPGYLGAFLVPLAATLMMCAAIVATPWMLPAMSPLLLLVVQGLFGGAVYAGSALLMSRRQIAELRRTLAREKPVA
jgi:O-antigen/teichoic acid export membrane protein